MWGNQFGGKMTKSFQMKSQLLDFSFGLINIINFTFRFFPQKQNVLERHV